MILIHCFRGQILLLWACSKTDVRVCKKGKGRHANRYLNQKQGREINAKKKILKEITMPIYRYIKKYITILFLIEMLGNLMSFFCNPSIMTNTLKLPIRK